MSLVSRLFRHSPWRYILSLLGGAAIAGVVLLTAGYTGTLAWANALTIAGAVLILCGALSWIARQGGFDMFRYAFSNIGSRRYKDFYSFTEAQQEKRRAAAWTFLPPVWVGLVCLLAGLLVWRS